MRLHFMVLCLILCYLGSLAYTAAPTITSFFPTSGPVGTVVTVNGSYLATVPSAKVNGKTATVMVNVTSITLTITPGTTTGKITITTPEGTATSADNFTMVLHLPDLTLRPVSTPTYTGARLYSTDGASQTVAQSVLTMVKASYYVQVQNFGNAAEAFTLSSATAPDGWTITYKNMADGSSITDQMTGAGWTTPVLAINGTAKIQVDITPGLTIPGNTVLLQVVTVCSTGDSTIRDVGVLQTTVLLLPPSFTSFTPSSGPVGQVITLTGANFTGATSVQFHGTPALTFSVLSATSLSATVPSGATTGTISVTTPGGTVTSTGAFTVLPALTAFTPTSGPIGQVVTISGTNLSEASAVKFNGTAATTFSVVNASTITATVPSGASIGKISVITPDGTATSTTNFSVELHLPDLTLRPLSNPSYTGTRSYSEDGVTQTVGQRVLAGVKASYYVQAQNFGNVAEAFKYTSTPAPAGWTITYKNTSDGSNITSQVTGSGWTTPVLAVNGTAKIQVDVTPSLTVFGGASASQVITVTSTADASKRDVGIVQTTVSYATPSMISFTPISGPLGQVVTITGTNFTGATAVQFNGTPAVTFSVLSDTLLSATVPDGATTGTISVTTPGGTATSIAIFHVIPAPILTSFTPSSGPIGQIVTITGTNLTGATAVQFNGTPAVTFSVLSDTLLSATVPDGATTGTISVTTPGGTVTSVAIFNVIPAPILTSFTPSSGPIGQIVTITGTNFTGATAVQFNGTPAVTFSVVSDTSLSATVPDGATTGSISVTTPTATATSVTIFTVTTNPIDGATIVWVPDGTFTMGSPDNVGSYIERPAHQVTLSGYWIYKYEVTVAQYRAFCAATLRALPPFPSGYSWAGKAGWTDPALQQHPIVNVTWYDATAYANWAGVSLPTEAQWEYAARGPAGNNYPWGGTATFVDQYNGWDQTKCANDNNSYSKNISTWPVGSFPADTSWCGAQDLAGNVEEWCADWFGNYYALLVSNPTGPATGNYRILRGSSWWGGSKSSVSRNYNDPTYRNSIYVTYGFRPVSLSPGPSALLPTITDFTPVSGSIGEVVTITGLDFTGTTVVMFNGTSATTFSVLSATTISAIVPDDATTGPISVTTPGGTVTSMTNFTVIVNANEVVPMVWVPGGTFTMGNPDELGDNNQHPAHQVTLSGFWIYKYEVTVVQYRAFCTATLRALPPFPSGYSWAGKSGWTDPTLQQHPIANVTWCDATAYADWAGVSLPTEAQWEYAARGVAGNNYPWGGTATDRDWTNGWDQTKCSNKYNSYNQNISTWPVGSFPAGASWCGAQDLEGNVREWCSDWYGTYSATPVTNPTGPATGVYRMLRCGSWYDTEYINRGAYRGNLGDPTFISSLNGFRCVSAAPTITDFTPTSGPPGQIMTISGTNFTGATAVQFNGTPAIDFTVLSATSITATAPGGATSGPISVTAPGGSGTSSTVFTFTPHATDGAAMVWVPGGSFTMGTAYGAWWNQAYTQNVTLSGYWIYKYEVTVAQYLAFCAATSRALPTFPTIYSWVGKSGWTDPALQQHPIVNVSWYDATAYAAWAGVTLPTEAQWEYAACGTAGNNYPWGGTATAASPSNGWDQTKCANYYNSSFKNISTWPVGSFPAGASWCGAQDLAGNVCEWCADWIENYSSTPVTNPTGPATGRYRVLRGGSWYSISDYRGAYRSYNNPSTKAYIDGFRCISVSPGP